MKRFSPYEHIVEAQQFDEEFLLKLFKEADMMKELDEKDKLPDSLKNRVVAMLFYEPSTRTRFSFETAVLKLGGKTISTENAREFSSVSKGESLKDTIRVIGCYADFVVMRHNQEGAAMEAAIVSKKPIINAGDGKGQHPTQALLDVYTMYKEFKRLGNLKVAMVGDLSRGRTVRSLSYLLSKFKGNKLYFVSPENSKMKEDILQHLKENNIEFIETDNLQKVLPEVDIVYMTRVQKERFESQEEYEKVKDLYIINKENIKLMKPNAILLHPLPRINEISTEVDSDSRCRIFEQARNGLYIRMALLNVLNECYKK